MNKGESRLRDLNLLAIGTLEIEILWVDESFSQIVHNNDNFDILEDVREAQLYGEPIECNSSDQ